MERDFPIRDRRPNRPSPSSSSGSSTKSNRIDNKTAWATYKSLFAILIIVTMSPGFVAIDIGSTYQWLSLWLPLSGWVLWASAVGFTFLEIGVSITEDMKNNDVLPKATIFIVGVDFILDFFMLLPRFSAMDMNWVIDVPSLFGYTGETVLATLVASIWFSVVAQFAILLSAKVIFENLWVWEETSEYTARSLVGLSLTPVIAGKAGKDKLDEHVTIDLRGGRKGGVGPIVLIAVVAGIGLWLFRSGNLDVLLANLPF